jgi:transposase
MPRPSRPEREPAERLLRQGASVQDVAARVGVPERTVQRWAEALRPDEPERPRPPTVLSIIPRAVEPEGDDDDDWTAEEIVEAAVGAGWSPRHQRQACERAGVTPVEADAIRARALSRMGRDLMREPVEQLAEYVLRVRHAQDVAVRGHDLGALTRLLSLEGRVLGDDEGPVTEAELAELLGLLPPRVLAQAIGDE